MNERAELKTISSEIYSLADLRNEAELPDMPGGGVNYDNIIDFPHATVNLELASSIFIKTGTERLIRTIDAQLIRGIHNVAIVKPDYFDQPEGKIEVITINPSGVKIRNIAVDRLRGPMKKAFDLATQERKRRILGGH